MGRAFRCDLCKKCFPLVTDKERQAYRGYFEDFMKDHSPEFSFELCPNCYGALFLKLKEDK